MNSGQQNSLCCCEVKREPSMNNACSVPVFDPPMVEHLVCSPKSCSIFGVHDFYPPTESDLPRKQRKRNANTLGTPIGLIVSSVLAKPAGRASEVLLQRYATCLKAFARIYVTPVSEWNTSVIDQLLKEGQQLFADSQGHENEGIESPLKIYSEAEAKVNRLFQLAGCTFHIELSEKYHTKENEVEKIGDELPKDMSQDLLKSALRGYFRQAKYCLVKLGNMYIIIWKSRGVYFVFDCNGRRSSDFISDRDKGHAMLICLKWLDNVVHLLQAMSSVKKEDTFSLRELKVVQLISVDGKAINREFGKRTNQYEIISPDFAALKSVLHLSLNPAYPARNRSALPVAAAVLLASKIDHPATWNQKMLDRIICYGVNVCKSLVWGQCMKVDEPIAVSQFPNQLKIGQFVADFIIKPPLFDGTWKCVPNFKNTELSTALKECLNKDERYFILRLKNQFYAIWMKNDFIYFMDPYRHRVTLPVAGEPTGEKSASLRMFRSIDVFLKVLNHVLLETNRSSPFYIYQFHVKKLKIVEKKEGVPEDEMSLEENDDVKSLNEAICFEEDQVQCLAELGEISDYEEVEEDAGVLVKVDQKQKEEKSEAEEEEEGGHEEEGTHEDLGEYESSSSGDDDDDGKGKGKTSKKRKSKSKKDKGGNDGKGKGKKGKKQGDGKNKKEKDEEEKSKKGKEKEKEGKRKSKKEKEVPEKKEDESASKKKKQTKETDKSKAKEEDTKDKDKAKEENRKDKEKDHASQKGQKKGSESDTDADEFRLSCKTNSYPGYSVIPQDMAVVGSENGSYESICKLLRAGFKCADRILTMTPWGNYVVFRGYNMLEKIYFLFDGCTCNVNRFRHLDLKCGTAGLLCFKNLHDVICYIIDSQKIRTCLKKSRKTIVDEICRQYCK